MTTMNKRIGIVGSRDFPALEMVTVYVRNLPAGTIIISGGARGVDQTAEEAARKAGLEVISLPALWRVYGKRAGFIRNEIIVEQAEEVVAFWDKKSRGTAHTIHLAKKLGKPVTVFDTW